MEDVRKVGEAEEDGSGVVDKDYADQLLGELTRYIEERNLNVTVKITDHEDTKVAVVVLTDISKEEKNIVGSTTLYNVKDEDDGYKQSIGILKGYISVGWININTGYGGLGWGTILLLYAILSVYFIMFFIKIILDDDSDNFNNPAKNIYNIIGFHRVSDYGPEKVMYLSDEILARFHARLEYYKTKFPVDTPSESFHKKDYKERKERAMAATKRFIDEQMHIINERLNPPSLRRTTRVTGKLASSTDKLASSTDKPVPIIKRLTIKEKIALIRADSKVLIKDKRKFGNIGGKKNKRKTKNKSKRKRKTKKRKSKKRI